MSPEIEAALSEEPEDELVRAELEEAQRTKRTGTRRIVAVVVSVVVIGLVFAVALPKIANYRDVWDVVKSLSWQRIVALVVASSFDVGTYASP
jgi:hypothetical protein